MTKTQPFNHFSTIREITAKCPRGRAEGAGLGQGRVDLCDGVDLIPFDRLTALFEEHLVA